MAKHPGRLLRLRFMEPLGLNANRLARDLGVNRSTIGRLLEGKQRLSPEMAARLALYFDVPVMWWLQMQADYDAFELAARHDLVEQVVPLALGDDFLVTPTGVLDLRSIDDQEGSQPIADHRQGTLSPSSPSRTPMRKVRQVRYPSGAVALVGDDAPVLSDGDPRCAGLPARPCT